MKKIVFRLNEETSRELLELLDGNYTIEQEGNLLIVNPKQTEPIPANRIHEQQVIYETVSLHRILSEGYVRYESGDLIVYPFRNDIQIRGKKITITGNMHRLLMTFLQNPDMTHSRESLITILEKANKKDIQDNTLTRNISRLRTLLGSYRGNPLSQSYIEVVRGCGYKWICDVKKVRVPYR